MIDRESISRCYERCADELFIYIIGYVNTPEAAEDILHDAFVKLIRHSEKKDADESNIRALLYTISRNLCIDYIRKNKKTETADVSETIRDTAMGVEQAFELDELNKALYGLLNRLAPLERSIFSLKKEMNITYREIADALKISERTVKRKMSSVLKYLTESLGKTGLI